MPAAEAADARQITDDSPSTIAYLSSFDDVFSALGRSDYRTLATVEQRLTQTYFAWADHPSVGCSQHGDLGLIIASLRLSHLTSTVDPIMREITADSGVQKRLRHHYFQDALAEFAPLKLSLHAVGTTSLIFRTSNRFHTEFAIKLLFPPYCFDERIAHQTATYRDTYGAFLDQSAAAVSVFESGPRFVLMEFADGMCLNDLVASELMAGTKLTGRLALAATIGRSLLRVIREMEASGIRHSDLNPRNIICDLKNEDYPVRLIDFGANYAISDNLGSASAIGAASEYIAPEVSVSGGRSSTSTSDIYSVGRLLLDVCRPEADEGESPTERLKKLYEEAPPMGSLIEDFTSRVPELRVRLASATASSPVSAHALQQFDFAFATASKLGPDGEMGLTSQGHLFGRVLRPVVAGGVRVRLKQLRQLSRVEASDGIRADQVGEFRRLRRWLLVVWYGELSAFFVLLWLTARDFGVNWGPFSLSFMGRGLPPDSHRPLSNLAGRLVIMSFVHISTAYYVNIFSGFSFRGLRIRGAKRTDAWLRFSAVACIPLAYLVYFVIPQYWAICSAIGTAIIAVNNRLVDRLMKRVLEAQLPDERPVTSSLQSGATDLRTFFSDQEFSSWWGLMMQYSIGLLALGGMLAVGIAHDLWVYVLFVLTMNFRKLLDSNCTKQAPKVRGNVARALALAQRCDL